jgi:hypothetical protein
MESTKHRFISSNRTRKSGKGTVLEQHAIEKHHLRSVVLVLFTGLPSKQYLGPVFCLHSHLAIMTVSLSPRPTPDLDLFETLKEVARSRASDAGLATPESVALCSALDYRPRSLDVGDDVRRSHLCSREEPLNDVLSNLYLSSTVLFCRAFDSVEDGVLERVMEPFLGCLGLAVAQKDFGDEEDLDSEKATGHFEQFTGNVLVFVRFVNAFLFSSSHFENVMEGHNLPRNHQRSVLKNCFSKAGFYIFT